MAAVLESSTLRRYVGLSTDEKPVTEEGTDTIPDGSYFLESDTGIEWRWDGAAWTFPRDRGSEYDATQTQHQLLAAILLEQRRLTQIIGLLAADVS